MAGDVELKLRGNSGDNHSSSTHSFHSGDGSSLVSVKTGCFQWSPNTVRGRRCQMIRMLILPFIPILALVAQNSTILSSAVAALWQVSEINGQISNTVQIGKLLAQVQLERAEIAYYMFSHSNQTRLALDQRFATTDDLIKNLSFLVDNEILSGREISFQNHLSEMKLKRKRILELASLNTSKCDEEALDEMVWYNQANDLILDQLGRKVRETNTGLWRALVAYSNMIKAIENLSIAMVYGFYYHCKGFLTPRSLSKYIRYDSLAEEYLNLTFHFSVDVFEKYGAYDLSHGHFTELRRDLKIQPGWFNSVRLFGLNRREVVYENELMAPDAAGAEAYFHNMTKYLELLKSYERHLLAVTREQIIDEMNSAKSQQLISAIMFTVILIVSPVIIMLIRNMTNTIQSYSTILTRKTAALKEEKKRSDRLLNQMLPSPVVRQLKLKKQVPAESFESVTIYFSDIVNFTRLSSSSSPMEIVIMLNSLYQIFDSRIEHYDVYKVETIGDAYMVVSGLPNRNGIQHAGEISTMALDLLNGVRMFEIPHRPSETLSIRIGINTGPCVAGVIGTKMPRYCLFGDAINTASRMESNGEAMKVHITEDTKVLLDAIGGYFTESRGTVEIKGKGEMNTFWLIGKEGGLPRSIEVSTPGYLKPVIKPEFVRDIFGEQFDYDDDD